MTPARGLVLAKAVPGVAGFGRRTPEPPLRRLVSSLLALLFVALAASPGAAIELRNHDRRPYAVTVKTKQSRKTLTMAGLSASIVVCVGSCTFRIQGGGWVRARGDDVVIIEDKRLRKR